LASIASQTQDSLGTVLITGGTDGLGRAAAILLAERGYRVFAGGRSTEKLQSLLQHAAQHKLPLEPITLDVCDDASVDQAIAEIERRSGPVEILVNNAGIAIMAAMEDLSLADLHRQFETNIFGVLRATKRVLPEMRRHRRGRIINMSSISGKVAAPLFGAYSSSKHALEAISDSMRLELYPFDVHVVLIEPGYIHTNMNRTAAELSSNYAKGADKSPYGPIYQQFMASWDRIRHASRYKPEDCARVVLRAVRDTPPRARYAVTRRAKTGILARHLLPDSAFDYFLKKQLSLDQIREKLRHERQQA
jgi:NAD(P)-dependent dehydrogenase (short-subunit alcohol dehydrogenase family)